MNAPQPFLRFFIPGVPVPQGSKKAWYNPKTQRVMMREAQGSRIESWRQQITAYARTAAADAGLSAPVSAAVSVSLTFWYTRPESHYGTGRNSQSVKTSAPPYPHKPPDIDKLVRAIFDGLTDAKVWVDDGQVVSITARKRWSDRYDASVGGVTVAIGLQPE